ncbi:hypothetical protein SKAU_G00222170 [Synaphobranchus kaupii]|uniref:Uncharacterized protein n=1 Tax=Synaphobranchus kaupii TaxID=118154 RepID=A0A9Q1FB49_SYNKA|nr:hypothetical protein SKAU_G00222170 [Synaphobranchus kaupii]
MSMRRLPQKLLSLCLTGALLLPLCQGNDAEYDDEYDDEYDYDTTAPPDYDYNATFDYEYLDNTSSLNYDLFEIMKSGTEDTVDDIDKRNTAPETGIQSLLLILCLSIHQLCQLQ